MLTSQLWRAFQDVHHPLSLVQSVNENSSPSPRPDNPFLIHYAVYHHYRALGWVVKGGIKFCVDYLLYKRGPVFHHAEYALSFVHVICPDNLDLLRFALVVIPVYEDETDRDTSLFNLQNVDPFSWSWLSTINRVNSQVHKVHIICFYSL